MRDIYREVTEQIIAELKNGVRPWVQPWSKTPGLNIPCNAVTGHAYRGVNLLLLWTTRLKGWPQPRFLSYSKRSKPAATCARASTASISSTSAALSIRTARTRTTHAPFGF